MSSQQEYSYTMRSIRRPFNKKFPTSIGAIIAVLQMFLNGAIVGLEGGSVAYNPKLNIIYAGFWCSIPFFFTWISMFAFLCFRKTFRWGLVVAGTNFVSIGFAAILIVFDCLFIRNPCRCYLATLCDLQNSSNFADVNSCVGSNEKLVVVIAQLACAGTMLASNIGYIIMFIVIAALSHAPGKKKILNPSYCSSIPSVPASPKILTTPPRQTLTYPVPNQPSYSPRYRPSGYPDQTSYWGPSMPFSNRFEKF